MLSIPIEFMVISGLLYCFNHRLNQPPHHASGRGCRRRRSRRRLRRCLRRGAAAWFLGNWGSGNRWGMTFDGMFFSKEV